MAKADAGSSVRASVGLIRALRRRSWFKADPFANRRNITPMEAHGCAGPLRPNHGLTALMAYNWSEATSIKVTR